MLTKTINIPIGSSVEKAYLISAHNKLASNISVSLNGSTIFLSGNTDVTTSFTSVNDYLTCVLNNSRINVIDVTTVISASTTNCIFITPPQYNYCVNGSYGVFYLYIIFKNNYLPKSTCNLFLNTQDASNDLTYYLKSISPIDNSKDVGLSFCGYYFNDTNLLDGSYVRANNYLLGLVGGDENSYALSGVSGDFSYFNNNLIGLGNDTPDNTMAGTDGLADIKNYVSYLDTSLSINFKFQQASFKAVTNPVSSIFLTYTTPCDTFSVKLLTEDTTVCRGQTLQLGVSGGQYFAQQTCIRMVAAKRLELLRLC